MPRHRHPRRAACPDLVLGALSDQRPRSAAAPGCGADLAEEQAALHVSLGILPDDGKGNSNTPATRRTPGWRAGREVICHEPEDDRARFTVALADVDRALTTSAAPAAAVSVRARDPERRRGPERGVGRRGSTPDHDIRIQVERTRPGKRTVLDAHRTEPGGIGPQLAEQWTVDQRVEIPLHDGTVRQDEPDTERIEGDGITDPQHLRRC